MFVLVPTWLHVGITSCWLKANLGWGVRKEMVPPKFSFCWRFRACEGIVHHVIEPFDESRGQVLSLGRGDVWRYCCENKLRFSEFDQFSSILIFNNTRKKSRHCPSIPGEVCCWVETSPCPHSSLFIANEMGGPLLLLSSCMRLTLDSVLVINSPFDEDGAVGSE